MDPTIIAAIVGGVATVIAAIIGVLSHKRKVGTSKQQFEKSKALRLGYVLAAIECYLDAQRQGTTSEALSRSLNAQSKRAHEIAKALGISVSPNADALIKELPLKLDTKLITVKNAFRIGNIIGRLYFYTISLITTETLPIIKIIDKDFERINKRISEAEQLLKDAGLPPDFLEPVKDLWKKKLQAIRKGNAQPIDVQMEEVLDQLCNSIEIGARHKGSSESKEF